MNSTIKVKHPIDIRWRIPEASLKEKRKSIKEGLKSEIFDIPDSDIQYYVDIYPNGYTDARRGKSTIFFNLSVKETKEIEAEITLSIETSKFIHKIESVDSTSWGRGSTICSVEELFNPVKRYIVNGELTVKVEGFIMFEKLRKPGENGSSLGNDLWNQECKDFTIVADGKEIMVHKFVLSSRSPVFAAMFQPHTQEAQQNKVIIPDFSFTIVETAIKLFYDSSLVGYISLEDRMALLQFFDKYDIQFLKDDLENLLIIAINESNVCRLANCSLISNAPNLQENCGELLQKCFRENKLLVDFINLDKEFAYEMFKSSLLKNSL